MKNHVLALVGVLACFPGEQVLAQSAPVLSPWVVQISPQADFPLADPNQLFSLAFAGRLGAAFLPKQLSGWEFGGVASYGSGTLRSSVTTLSSSLSEISAGATTAYTYQVIPSLAVRGYAVASAVYGSLSSDSSSGTVYPSVEAGAGLQYSFNPEWAVRLDAGWLQKLGLYGGVQGGLSLAWRIPEPRATTFGSAPPRLRLLDFSNPKLGSIFPIFQTYYDDHPVGTIRITNTGKEKATDLKVSFLMRQYMDAAKDCLAIPELSPGESRDVPLFALFRNNILDVTEATKATAEVTVEYQTSEGLQTQTQNASLRVYDRNAMTWDDDRKAAAFVSGKDPWVLDLSNNLTAAVKDLRNQGVNKNLQTALAFHNGLRIYGLSYVINPKTPFAQAFAHPESVDFLKFPRQTLAYKAGDCSDLSILYASLFESVGIETAFITVPGHIFMALNLEMTPAVAQATLSPSDDLIFLEGKSWMPLEVTMRDSSLIEIWREASREWKKGQAEGTAAFYPIHEAWKTFSPVGLPADNSNADSVAKSRVTLSFETDLGKIVDQEVSRRTIPLSASLKLTPTPKLYNSRGVVFARFEKLPEAERDFKAASTPGTYAPALINLGNIAFLKLDNQGAFNAYQKAAKLTPDNAKLQINLARAANALGKAAEANQAMAVALRLDPALASQYASLASGAEGNRAAEKGEKTVFWDEE